MPEQFLEPRWEEKMAKKIIVAVHGIGGQFTYATIQTVAYQFCGFHRAPAGIPLGGFHAKRVGKQGALFNECFRGKK